MKWHQFLSPILFAQVAATAGAEGEGRRVATVNTPTASATTSSTEVRFDRKRRCISGKHHLIVLFFSRLSRAGKLQHRRLEQDARPLVLREDEGLPEPVEGVPRREAVQGPPRQVLVQRRLQQRLHPRQGQEERRHLEHDGQAGRAAQVAGRGRGEMNFVVR